MSIRVSLANRAFAVGLSMAALACGGGDGGSPTNPTTGSPPVSQDPQTPVPPSGCALAPSWNTYLVDPAAINVVTQIGVVGGGNTELVGRSYVFPRAELVNTRIPLTAPADARITVARRYAPPGAPAGYTPDWVLVLEMGCGRSFELYHIKDVAPAIKAVSDTVPAPTSAWQPLATPVSIKAGDVFAWYIPGLNSVAFDVILHDAARTNRFINQERYVAFRSNILDVVCPWTPFAPAKRDAYLELIGTPEGIRVPGAGCGTVERDVAGTAAGQWFGSPDIANAPSLVKNGPYGSPLPIIMGADSTVYIGHIGANNDVRIRRDNPSWRSPASITTSWCYQIRPTPSTASGWLWLRLNTATQMDVSYAETGTCPESFPTEFQRYWR